MISHILVALSHQQEKMSLYTQERHELLSTDY